MDGISKDEDISIDSDEREFLENVSWDTSSDEEDIEKDDQIMDSKIFKPDGDLDPETAQHLQNIAFEQNYNMAFHEFKKKYTEISIPYIEN